MNLLLVHGPNLNLLGERKPEIYGRTTLLDIETDVAAAAGSRGAAVLCFQSNHEGALVDRIHVARTDGTTFLIINAGAFTHYAYALADALATFDGVKVELHLSNPGAREPWRHVSVLTPVVDGVIAGLRGTGYRLAIEGVAARLEEQ